LLAIILTVQLNGVRSNKGYTDNYVCTPRIYTLGATKPSYKQTFNYS